MEISIFCDESCHLEHDRHKVMLLGAVSCARENVRLVSQAVRQLKHKHGLKVGAGKDRGFEIKWSKVGPAFRREHADFWGL